MRSKLGWLVIFVWGLATAASGQGQRGVDFSEKLLPILEDVYVFEGVLWVPGEEEPIRTNSLVVVDPQVEAVLVADGQDTLEEGELLIKAIREVTPFPIRYLVNASPHVDHTRANVLFKDATIIGQERAVAEIGAQATSEFEPVTPNLTYTKQLVIQLGGTRVELLYYGPAHSPADTLVYLPDQRLVFLSEMYFNNVFPAVQEGFAENHLEVIRRAKQLDVDWLIPGHGVVTGESASQLRAGLDRYEAQIRAILDTVRKHVSAGGSLDTLLETADDELAPFRDVPFYDFLKPRSLRGTYEALTKQ